MATYTGKCLCGQTSIKIGGKKQDTQVACHCIDCQKTSGTAHSSNYLAPIAEVEISGAVKTYESPSARGNIVTRVFCGNCGSPFAHKSKGFGDKMAVQTAQIDEFRKIPYGAEVFVKDRWSGMPVKPNAAQNDMQD